MSSYTLVSHHLCPYVQRASIALAEKDVPFTRKSIDLADKPDWFMAISPTGKVPLLIVDESRVLFESAAICDYLDETLTPRLHPEDAADRARHRAWIEFASGTLNEIASLYSAPDKLSFDAKVISIGRRFAQIEDELNEGPYFSGSRFSLVDAAYGPVFRYFDVFESFIETGVFAQKPKLMNWRRRLSARDSVRNAVSPDYAARLKSFLLDRQSYMTRLLLQEA